MKLHYCESCERFWYFHPVNHGEIVYTTVWETPLAPILCTGNDELCPNCELSLVFISGLEEDQPNEY
jgi:hypothetical protein